MTVADSSRRSFEIGGIDGCRTGTGYVARDGVVDNLKAWFTHGTHAICFLKGEAGIGKTNLLFHALTEHKDFCTTPAIFFSFRDYKSSVRLQEQLIAYLPEELQRRFTQRTLLAVILNSPILIVLDGLDELARSQGESVVHQVADEIFQIAKESDKKKRHTRIIVTCRDHELQRLRNTQILRDPFHKHAVDIVVPLFDEQRIRKRIRQRFDAAGHTSEKSEDPRIEAAIKRIIDLCRRPLFYDAVRQMADKDTDKLLEADTSYKLYDRWYDYMLDKLGFKSKERNLKARVEIAEIAIFTLRKRTDLIDLSDLEETDGGVDLGRTVQSLTIKTGQPNGLFVNEGHNIRAFAHQSLREFILAWATLKELKGRKFNILARSPCFDYLGSELFQYVDESQQAAQLHGDALNRLIRTRSAPKEDERWNPVVVNILEGIGMLENGEPDHLGKIVRSVLKIATGKVPDRYVAYRTRYNAVRCLERLHPSSPKPYFRAVMRVDVGREGSFAATVRGFHRTEPAAGVYPYMTFRPYSSTNVVEKLEREVASGLFRIIRTLHQPELPQDAEYLKINCTLALIRWLPDSFDNWESIGDLLTTHLRDVWSQLNVFRLVTRKCQMTATRRVMFRKLDALWASQDDEIQKYKALTAELDKQRPAVGRTRHLATRRTR